MFKTLRDVILRFDFFPLLWRMQVFYLNPRFFSVQAGPVKFTFYTSEAQ